ncbi:hypothetical protein L1987_66863 [Smallanthus sonchifolius]|uniref:Uncharacterized protein n=1 Tax=Smallanthus sonchifolius TaxID=185202 RepID=A0ACB9BYA9_9ASTR|nr:hypothetical protein L1987_66863 [Smallanthus sonchifolius]
MKSPSTSDGGTIHTSGDTIGVRSGANHGGGGEQWCPVIEQPGDTGRFSAHQLNSGGRNFSWVANDIANGGQCYNNGDVMNPNFGVERGNPNFQGPTQYHYNRLQIHASLCDEQSICGLWPISCEEQPFNGGLMEGKRILTLVLHIEDFRLGFISLFITIIDIYLSRQNIVDGQADWHAVLGLEDTATLEKTCEKYYNLYEDVKGGRSNVIGVEGALQILSEAFCNVTVEFWTMCPRCQFKFQYSNDRMNKEIVCFNCHICYLAVPLSSGAHPTSPRTMSRFERRKTSVVLALKAPSSEPVGGSGPSKEDGDLLIITNCADIKRLDFHHTYLASLAEAIRVTGLIYVNDATVRLTVLEPTLMCKTSSPVLIVPDAILLLRKMIVDVSGHNFLMLSFNMVDH